MSDAVLPAPFFVRGRVVNESTVRHTSRDLGASFATPELDLDAIVVPRSELPPALGVKVDEIIDLLVETGEALSLDKNPHMQGCLERLSATNPLPRRIVENLYRSAPRLLNRESLETMLSSNFDNRQVLDGWVTRVDQLGNQGHLRAFPPRMIHMLAGNAPAGCIASVAQGALVKGINLFKMPSSDPFTTVAVLRTMAEVDANHPVVRSMSAVYWPGGDDTVERTIYRPQFFDRIVAWGGGPAIMNVIKYLGPGIQLVSFDPKSSISMVGREVFESDEILADVADRVAQDTTVYNQEACLASRYVFIEGEQLQIERFCDVLAGRLAVDRDFASAQGPPLPADIRGEIEVMETMGELKTWGRSDGSGLVVLSDRPVDFYPSNKTSNVVKVPALEDAVQYVNVATQTIGMYPWHRKPELRDRVASAGGQRLCRVGTANKHVPGGPHDAMFALQRFVHWMADDDITQ